VASVTSGTRRRVRSTVSRNSAPADTWPTPASGHSERGQQAEQRGQRQRPRINAAPGGSGKHAREQRCHRSRHQSSEEEGDRDAENSKRQDLDEVDRENEPCRRAKAFERGDRRGLAGNIATDRVADPDPADQQRAQTDETEEERDTLDRALQGRRRFAKGADLPTRFGKGGARRLRPGRGVRPRREPHPVTKVYQRAGLDQPSLDERLGGDHDARAKAEAAGLGIRLALNRGTQLQHRRPHLDVVADLETEPGKDRGVDRRTKNAPAAFERGGQALRRGQSNRTVERVGGVNRLQLDQTSPVAVECATHRPHRGDFGHRSAPREVCVFGGIGLAVGEPSLGVAAEQLARVGLDAGHDGIVERADPSDHGHPEHEAGEKDAQTPDPAAQLAAGEPKGKKGGGRGQRARRAMPTRNGVLRRSSTILPSRR